MIDRPRLRLPRLGPPNLCARRPRVYLHGGGLDRDVRAGYGHRRACLADPDRPGNPVSRRHVAVFEHGTVAQSVARPGVGDTVVGRRQS